MRRGETPGRPASRLDTIRPIRHSGASPTRPARPDRPYAARRARPRVVRSIARPPHLPRCASPRSSSARRRASCPGECPCRSSPSGHPRVAPEHPSPSPRARSTPPVALRRCGSWISAATSPRCWGSGPTPRPASPTGSPLVRPRPPTRSTGWASRSCPACRSCLGAGGRACWSPPRPRRPAPPWPSRSATDRLTFVDVGEPESPVARAVLEVADATLLVVRECYLALRRASSSSLTGRAFGLVVLQEPGRALGPSRRRPGARSPGHRARAGAGRGRPGRRRRSPARRACRIRWHAPRTRSCASSASRAVGLPHDGVCRRRWRRRVRDQALRSAVHRRLLASDGAEALVGAAPAELRARIAALLALEDPLVGVRPAGAARRRDRRRRRRPRGARAVAARPDRRRDHGQRRRSLLRRAGGRDRGGPAAAGRRRHPPTRAAHPGTARAPAGPIVAHGRRPPARWFTSPRRDPAARHRRSVSHDPPLRRAPHGPRRVRRDGRGRAGRCAIWWPTAPTW